MLLSAYFLVHVADRDVLTLSMLSATFRQEIEQLQDQLIGPVRLRVAGTSIGIWCLFPLQQLAKALSDIRRVTIVDDHNFAGVQELQAFLKRGLVEEEKARKRMKSARQMIDKQRFTMTWVVMDDVRELVKAEGVTDNDHVRRNADQLWNPGHHQVCFPLEIYRTAQGEEGTQAEFMCEWLWAGYSWADSKAHLKELTLSGDDKRECPETFREEAMQRLRENIGLSVALLPRTYAPKRKAVPTE